jgi:hypothetical protein
LPVSPIYFRCVNTERHYANAPRLKLRKPVLETPQLGVTERSPVAAVED